MVLFGGESAYRILKWIRPPSRMGEASAPYASAREKLMTHFGAGIWDRVRGKTVLDFGCGEGGESVALAQQGAARVIGLDLRDSVLQVAAAHAEREGYSDRCDFCQVTDGPADLIFSLDSFEHFADPAAVLREWSRLLAPQGEVLVSFGWTWYHPYGGHLFSVFPWAHLIFSEESLIRWRSEFKTDGATRFDEVEGGLNQMTIARFERIVAESPLELVELRLRPIRAFRWIHCRPTREFTTALVFGRLRLPAA